MNVYSCLENLDYYYIESGFHSRFPELVDSDEDVLFFFCNMCHPNITSIVKDLVDVSIRSDGSLRFILIHLDALYGQRDPISNIDLLQYENDIFSVLDELFSLTLHLECFHIEHLSVLDLLRNSTLEEISLETPTHCIYSNGTLSEQFDILHA